MSAEIKTADVDKIAAEGAWSPSPLYAVQLALLRSRTIPSVPDAIEVLDIALIKARELSFLYEECRLQMEFSDRLWETDPDAAQRHSEEAIRIAKKNGYRPLLSKALLLRGLSARHNKERSHFLQQSFKLATEVGIPEIVSKSSYYSGVLHHAMKQYAAAREYLANSTRVTSEIAGRIPDRFRAKYLSRPWRTEARKLFQEYLQEQPIRLPAVENVPSPREHPHFRALYRISVAAASAKTVEDFIRDLLPMIGHAQDKTVVMLKADVQTSWYSLGVSVSDELRVRVLSVANKARDQFRFNPRDRWIPIRSIQFSGGIFVISRRGSQMGEDEMEYFTILGTFVGTALDQIHTRTSARPTAVEVEDFHGIVGSSRPIRDLRATLKTISNNNATVLIQGETGTGKELVARAIHKLSARSTTPFIPLDCGAIAESLMESELFGSKKGSFTGATEDRPGVFEAAHKGTLFLDEISNMNLGMQAKLLRVLQEREIRRIGETRSRPIDVRLIAASNANLKQLVAEGSFRQDLLFRLNVIGVHIPPLRERREDLADLAAHFLNKLNSEHRTNRVFGPEALLPLFAHSFPGNIRELRNCIERSYFTAGGRTIVSIPLDAPVRGEHINEVQTWLRDLSEGRRNFWTAIHDRYKRRDISRETVTALIDLGLRTTRGSYKNLASLLRIEPGEYRKLMDFLRRNDCLLDFRPYRKVATPS
jgi:DNA-binding NtrC family response regulator